MVVSLEMMEASMPGRAIALNGKSVLASEPYRASLAANEPMIGRIGDARMVLAAWVAQPDFPPLSPLLVGEPGAGKNRLVYELARCTRKELYVLQGHEDVTPDDFVCAVRFSDDPAKKMDYVLSPLATAMLRGGICFIDEIGKIRARALAPLVSVLDERRYLDSNLLGERVIAHPGFRFIAATNTNEIAQDVLPDFIRSRLRPVIDVGLPGRDEIGRIVTGRFRRLDGNGTRLLEEFWNLWSEHGGEAPPSPRDALYLFGLTLNIADAEACGLEWHPEGAGGNEFVSPEPKHLQRAFRQLFPPSPERKELFDD